VEGNLCLHGGDAPEQEPLRALREGAAALGVSLEAAELRRFAAYEEELLRWNRLVSLVAVKSPLDIAVKHFLDSLSLLPHLPREEGLRLLDIGTGGGFPGLPLKIVRPEIELHLLEISRKKVSFLREAVRKLGLTGVEVIHERVEAVIRAGLRAGAYDAVVSRAAFPTAELLAMGAHFLRPGGLLLVMRGPRKLEEPAVSQDLYQEKAVSFRLPVRGYPRMIIIFRKAAATLKSALPPAQ